MEAADLEEIEGHSCGCLDLLSFLSFAETFEWCLDVAASFLLNKGGLGHLCSQ